MIVQNQWAAGFVVLLGVAGCATTQPQMDESGTRDQPFAVTAYANGPHLTNVTFGKSVTSVKVVAEATCARKEISKQHLYIQPEGGYLLLAYQNGQGQVPVRLEGFVEQHPKSAQGSSILKEFNPGPYGGAVVLVLAALTAPVWYPIYQSTKTHDVAGCFVWIERTDTGEVVSGSTPW